MGSGCFNLILNPLLLGFSTLRKNFLTGALKMKKNLSSFSKYNEEDAIGHFNQNGYFLFRGFFNKKTAIDAACWVKAQATDKLAKSWTEQEPGVPLAVYSVVDNGNSPIAQLVSNPKILEMAGKLIGKPTYLWSSKVNIKAPWCGAVEYYHQDLVYWKDRGYSNNDMLSCMIFLEKHNFHNAALQVLAGTHRLGFVSHQPFININGLSKRMIPPETLNKLFKDHGLESIEAEPGDALFFHSCLVHGSSHNISPNGRMIALAQLNTTSNKPKEVLSNTKRFNLLRAQAEVEEADRRYKYFKEKYDKQLESDEPLFCPPIPDQEK